MKANSERAEITRWTGLFGEALYGQLPALLWAASGRGPGCSLASWTCCHSEELRLRRWEHSLESAVCSLQRDDFWAAADRDVNEMTPSRSELRTVSP